MALGKSLSPWGLSFLSYKTNSLKWSLRVLNLAFWDYSVYTVLWVGGGDSFRR